MKTKNYFFIIAFLCMSMISATAANLILNPGFEDATNTAWTLQGTTIQTTTVNSGTKAAKVAQNNQCYQMVNLQPNTTYTLNAYVKVVSGSMFIGVTPTGGTVTNLSVTANSTFTKKSITFTTGTTTEYKIWFWSGTAGVEYYVDDVDLMEPTPASESTSFINPGFEDADLSAWTLQGADIVTTNFNSGAKAAHMIANNNLFQLLTLASNTTYTISCYAKVVGSGANTFLGVSLNNGNVFISNVPISATTFTKYDLTFTTTVAGQYKIWAWTGTAGDYYFDDFQLVKSGTTDLKNDIDSKIVEIIKQGNSNPNIEIKINEVGKSQIAVYNINGKKIYSQSSDKQLVMINNNIFSNKGIYLIEVKVNNRSVVNKIVF